MNIQKYSLVVLLLVMIFSSCSESTFEQNGEEQGYDYYPIVIGNEWIYEVDSTIYLQDGADVLKSISQVKEEITELLDPDGEKYIITKSVRKSDTDPWVVNDKFLVENDGEKLYKTELNRRFIKLVFPVREGKKWDGNVHFDSSADVDVFGNMLAVFEDWDYKIQQEVNAVEIANNTYNDVIRVEQSDSGNVGINYSRNYEQYAKGVGLIYRENNALSSQIKTPDVSWEDAAQEGFIIKYTLLSHNQ